MTLKEIFYGIESFFENVAFAPYEALRSLQLDSWWLANIFSWILLITGVVAFVYWMLQLKNFKESEESTYKFKDRQVY